MSEAVEMKKMTIEEYYALPEGTRAELIYGVIYDMSPSPLRIHQDISEELNFKIKSFVKKNKGNCKVYSAPFDVKLNEDTVVQPDISVICDNTKLTDKGCSGAPDFIIEIASSNALNDYVRKLNLYAESGVREYWIVDPRTEKVKVYLLEEDYAVKQYKFTDDVPVNIYGGELTINISELLSE